MSLRKMEGLPGTADLPDPETIRELVQDQESLEVKMVVLSPAPEVAPVMEGIVEVLIRMPDLQ